MAVYIRLFSILFVAHNVTFSHRHAEREVYETKRNTVTDERARDEKSEWEREIQKKEGSDHSTDV